MFNDSREEINIFIKASNLKGKKCNLVRSKIPGENKCENFVFNSQGSKISKHSQQWGCSVTVQ